LTAIATPLTGLTHHAARLAVKYDLMRGALALLIILNVSRLHQHWRWMAVFRPALVLAALAALYAFLAPTQLSTKGLFKTRPAQLTLAFFLFACAGAPFGLSLGNSAMFIIENYSKVIVAALLMIAAVRNTRDLYTFVWAYVIGCGFLAYFSIFVFGLSKAGSQAARLGNMYTFDANDVGLVMVVGLPLTILVLQSARGLGKVLAGLIVIGIAMTIARTGSRGAFVALIATGLGMLFLLKTVPVWKRVAFVLVTGVTLIFAAPAGYWDQMATILSPKEDYNWTTQDGRKEVTKRGLSYMLSYPIFGLGINNFYRAECIDPVSTKVRFHKPGTGIRCTAPHNSYIEAGAELGVPGLIMWLMLLFGGIASLLRMRRSLPAGWRTGDPEQRFLYQATVYLAVTMVGFSVGSFFVSFAFIDIPYILVAMMAGLIVSAEDKLMSESAAPGAAAMPWLEARPTTTSRPQRLSPLGARYRRSVYHRP
jgi:O-antigen ligase